MPYLPPVVVTFTGDSKPFQTVLAEVKAELADFAKTVTSTKIGADSKLLMSDVAADKVALADLGHTVTSAPISASSGMFQAGLAEVKVELLDLAHGVTDANLGADAARFWEEITALRTEVSALSPLDLDVNASTAAAMAKIAALWEELDLATVDRLAKVVVAANTTQLLTKLAQAQTQLYAFSKQVVNSKLGADTAPFWVDILELREILARDPATLDVDADIKPALAKLAALRGALALASIGTSGQLVSTATLEGAVAAKAFTRGASGGRGGIAAFLAAMGFTHTGWLRAFATFGSLGSLMGFGFEHALTTVLGLAGSAVGGLIGGGLLGASALSVGLTGFATDLAGIGQAEGDIKSVYTAMTNLQTAIATYGASSTEAATAQSQLNQAVTGFSPVARQAVVAVAQMGQAIHAEFNKYTGLAEKLGAQIIGMFGTVAEAYIPTIGKYAAINMSIIEAGLAPLISWLKSPTGGLGDFTTLENVFTRNLPTAIHAFDQALEVLMKTMAFIAPETGRFIGALNRLFTRLNTPAGFAKWETEVTHLIALFRTWEAFFKVLVEDIALVFKRSAGLGSGIIQTLTGDLNRLHKALESKASGSALSSLFTTHKDEVIDLLQTIIQLGDAFTKMYLLAAPTLVRVATFFIKILDVVTALIDKIPALATAFGFALLFAKWGVLGALFTGASKDASALQKVFGFVGNAIGIVIGKIGLMVKALVTSGWVTSATTYLRAFIITLGDVGLAMIGVESESIALRTAMGIGLLGGIGLVAAAVYELIHHFGALKGLMIAGAGAVGILTVAMWALDSVPIVAAIAAIVLGIAGLVAGIIELSKHWGEVASFFRGLPGKIVGEVGSPDLLFNFGKNLVLGLWHGAESAAGNVEGLFKGLWDNIFGGGGGSGGANLSAFDKLVAAINKAESAGNSNQLKTYLQDLKTLQAGGLDSSLPGIAPEIDKVTTAIKGLRDATHSTQSVTTQYQRVLDEFAASLNTKVNSAVVAYGNDLQKLNPITGGLHDKTATLNRVFESIGPALAKAGTGFNTFTVGAAQDYSQLVKNLLVQNADLSAWAHDAQILLKRGMDPAAIASLAQIAPQDLAKLVTKSKAQLAYLSYQFQLNQLHIKALGAGTAAGFAQTIINGLHSADPYVREAAKALAKQFHINVAALGLNAEGLNAGQSFAAGVASAATAVKNAAVHMSGALGPSLTGIDLASEGESAGATFAQGLKNSLSTISPAAFLVGGLTGQSLLKGMSKSPPLYWVGEEAAAGFTQGLVDGATKAITTAKVVASRVIAAFGSLKNFRADIADLASVTTLVNDLSRLALALSALPAAFSKIGNLGDIAGKINRLDGPVSHITAAFAHLLDLVGKTASLNTLAAPLSTLIGTLGQLGTALAGLTTGFAHFDTTVQTLRKLPYELHTLAGPVESVVTAYRHLLDGIGNTTALNKLATPLVSLIGTLGQLGTALGGLTKAFAHFGTTARSIRALPDELHDLDVPLQNVVRSFQHLVDMAGKTGALGAAAAPLPGVISTLGRLGTALSGLTTAFAKFGTTAATLRQLPKDLHDIDYPLQNVVRSFQHLVDTVGKTGNLGSVSAPLPGIIATLGRLGTALSALSGDFAKFGTTASTLRKLPDQLHDLDGPLRNVVLSFEHLVDTVGKTGNLGTVSAPLPGIITNLGHLGSALAGLTTDFAKFGTTARTIRELPKELHDLDGPLRDVVLSFEHLIDSVGKTGTLGTIAAPLPGVITILGQLGAALSGLTKDFTHFTATASAIRKLPDQLHDLDAPLQNVVRSFQHLLAGIGNTTALEKLGSPLPALIGELGQLGTALSALSKDFTGFTTTLVALKKLPSELHWFAIPIAETVQAFRHLLNAVGNTSALDKLATPLDTTLGLLGQFGTALGVVTKAFANFNTTISAVRQLPSELSQLSGPIQAAVKAFQSLLEAAGNTKGIQTAGTSLVGVVTALGGLGAALKALTPDFANFATTMTTLRTLPGELQPLGTAIGSVLGSVKTALGGFGNLTTVSTGLSSVTTVFQRLATAFAEIGLAAKNAALVTPAAIKAIAAAVGLVTRSVTTNLGTQLASSVALGLGSSAPVTAMRNMIATLVRVAKSLAPEMVGVGEQLMKSLALGIEKGLKYPRKAIQEVPLAPRIAANYAAGSAGSSSQAITFHTEVKVNVNNAESANIARAIKQAMEQHDRNLVRSFRAGIGSGAIPRTV